MKVKSVKYAGKADVYNMTVEGTHDFVVQGGVITHNCDEIRYFCMMRPIAPRVIETKMKPMHDPQNQYAEHGKYHKYNAIKRG